jgi:hypothetical protein
VLVLVDQAAEDGCAADGVFGEAHGGWWIGLDSGWALCTGLVRAMAVVVRPVLIEDLHQMGLVEDQKPVEQLAAQSADQSFADRVGSRACAGLVMICMPSAANTASNAAVNLVSRSLITKRSRGCPEPCAR